MNYAQQIIQLFGGVRPTAAALQCSPSTVQGWKDRGSIPDEKKVLVLDTAKSLGIPLSRGDFWPVPTQEGAAP